MRPMEGQYSPPYRPYFVMLLIGLYILAGLFVVLSSVHDAHAEANEAVFADTSKVPIQTQRAFNIAHRGANGQYPEETARAYERAIEVGADFIETDILSTKDGVLICIHDVILDDMTDVLNHTQFADRVRTYEVERKNITGIFTVDMTLAEIKTLKARQRYSFRDHSFDDQFPLITFEEYLTIALNAPRVVGVYPEMKNPVFINEHVKWPGGKRYEDIFLETLLKFGYKGTYLSKEWLQKPLFIQSFAPSSLIYASNFTDSPKILLIDDVDVYTQDTNQSFAELTSDVYLDFISHYVVGIGPWKDTICLPTAENFIKPPTHLVEKAHQWNLQVHPYTFRNENQFLHFNFVEDAYQEYDYWIRQVHVDGLFTDFAQSLHLFQEWSTPLKGSAKY